jgi:3'(2'), 5'-bisphosphate nucleotidase
LKINETKIKEKNVFQGKNDLQTQADRSAQQCIVSSLSKQFPSIKIIGEEEQSANECPTPQEWLVTDSDPSVLGLQCPKDLEGVKEDEVLNKLL